jgi:hypothetical protein
VSATAAVAADGFRELAAAMETGATESERLGGVGLAYFDFALQKRDLFRLMFGPILVERAKYQELIGIRGRLATPSLPHHRAYGSVPTAVRSS